MSKKEEKKNGIRVTIELPDGETMGVELPEGHPAMEAVDFDFNPSGSVNVFGIKAFTAAFIALCDKLGGSREFSIAKTKAEEASMWAVKGATAKKGDK